MLIGLILDNGTFGPYIEYCFGGPPGRPVEALGQFIATDHGCKNVCFLKVKMLPKGRANEERRNPVPAKRS